MTSINSRIITNASYLFISDIFVKLFTAVATIFVVRYLGSTKYGFLGVALAFSAITGYFTDLGITQTLIREGTKPNPDIPHLVGGALKLRLILAIIASIINIVLILLLYKDVLIRNVTLLISIPTIWGVSLQGLGTAYFQVIQEMKYSAVIRCVSGLVTASTLSFAVIFHWPLIHLAVAYGLSSLIGGMLSLHLVRKRVPILGGWHPGILNGLWAFTIGGFLVLALPQLGPLILQRVANMQEVGIFSAAYRLPTALYAIPGIIASAFYPQLFNYGVVDSQKHFQLSVRELKYMGILGLCLALPMALYAEWIVHALFGAKWDGTTTAQTLSILAWLIAFQGINYPLADALTTQGLQSCRIATLGISICTGITLYFLLGSHYGATGAAFAAITIEASLLIGYTLANPQGKVLLFQGIIHPFIKYLPTFFCIGLLKCLAPIPMVGACLTPITFAGGLYLTDSDIRNQVLRLIRKFTLGKP
ncbi:MAG TPA: oligosaccharide flippase family protein [Armatimonadota bacterium]|nr:oligosaccharide flippase family protein [Armatimonadota bacterium]